MKSSDKYKTINKYTNLDINKFQNYIFNVPHQPNDTHLKVRSFVRRVYSTQNIVFQFVYI